MRTVERLSYFPFYPADYLLDTGDLTLSEHGAYLLLMLRFYWDGELLKKNIYRDCKSKEEREVIDRVIARFFHEEGDTIVHNRVARELEKLARYVEHQSKAGKASGAARSKKKEARTRTPEKLNGALHGFEEFYAAYPKHVDRAKAQKAWAAIKADEALRARIMAAVEAQKKSADWKKENGKFIPHPTTWLHGKRWEDEVGSAITGRSSELGNPFDGPTGKAVM